MNTQYILLDKSPSSEASPPAAGYIKLVADENGVLKTIGSDGATAAASADGKKIYRALLTQTGTAAPVVTELENTYGGAVVWTRDSTGFYYATRAGAFRVSKTVCFATNGVSGPSATIVVGRVSDDIIGLKTIATGSESVDDGILIGASIEITSYP